MAFKKVKCSLCNKEISIGGAAYVSHMRMHVRKRELIERKVGDKIEFVSTDSAAFLDSYAKLGNIPILDQPKEVWDATDALVDLALIDPKSYFITSGEAILKAEKLVRDSYSLAIKARSFRDKLKKARGNRKYLQSGWELNRLLCRAKDPRIKINKVDEE